MPELRTYILKTVTYAAVHSAVWKIQLCVRRFVARRRVREKRDKKIASRTKQAEQGGAGAGDGENSYLRKTRMIMLNPNTQFAPSELLSDRPVVKTEEDLPASKEIYTTLLSMSKAERKSLLKERIVKNLGSKAGVNDGGGAGVAEMVAEPSDGSSATAVNSDTAVIAHQTGETADTDFPGSGGIGLDSVVEAVYSSSRQFRLGRVVRVRSSGSGHATHSSSSTYTYDVLFLDGYIGYELLPEQVR